jgi:hypothetical protein
VVWGAGLCGRARATSDNPGFNSVEFDGIRIQTGLNSFVLAPKQWIEKTGAIGLRSSAGRYGGTYAHKDIAITQKRTLLAANQGKRLK